MVRRDREVLGMSYHSHVRIVGEGDLEDIALFRLNEEKEHILRFVRR